MIVDLGAHGTVEADAFGVELEKYDGTTCRFAHNGPFATTDIDEAEKVANDFMDECRVNGNTTWMDAYVITLGEAATA